MPHVRLCFGERVVHVAQTAQGVRLATEGATAIGHHEGRYLIACDGANSIIRKWLGIEFEGLTYPEKFYCVTTPFAFAEHFAQHSNVNYVADPAANKVFLLRNSMIASLRDAAAIE